LFRDDRPFNAGDHSLAVSRFPLPSVFRGAVRTALFEAAGADFRQVKAGFGLDPDANDDPDLAERKRLAQEILGGPHTSEAFAIRGPLVARMVGDGHYEYVLPWPGDLVITRTPEKHEEPESL